MKRLPGLDLLRAIAIVWVMLFHSWIVGGLSTIFAGVQSSGWMGVDLFFVLSGYLIGGQLLRPLKNGVALDFLSFYICRSYRILPAYAVVLAMYFLLPGFNREGPLAPPWEFLTYTLNIFIDYAHEPAFSHAWSLCVEEHFYLVFPLIAWLLTRRPTVGKVLLVAIAVVAFGMALRGVLWLHGHERFLELIYYPTWCRLDGLLAGVLLAALQTYRPAAWSWCQKHANDVILPAGLLLLALGLYVCRQQASHATATFGYPLLAAAFSMLVIAGAAPTSLLAMVTIPSVHWLAMISYSLYLIHKAMFKLAEKYMPLPFAEHPLAIFVAYASLTLLGGAALHYLVEAPFLAIRDRRRPSVLPIAHAAVVTRSE